MPGHTRLYRRGAVYYHRAAVPVDIRDTYGKREETFSLGTKDHSDAVRLIRVHAIEVDRRFEDHRRQLQRQAQREQSPPLTDLTRDQIARAKSVYLHHLLDEDEEVRLNGFEEFEKEPEGLSAQEDRQFAARPTFEEHEELIGNMEQVDRRNLARGKLDKFHRDEAEDLLSWEGIELRLDPASPSWPRLVRAVQEASVEAAQAIAQRNRGERVTSVKVV